MGAARGSFRRSARRKLGAQLESASISTGGFEGVCSWLSTFSVFALAVFTLAIFVLAVFVGFLVITKVPPTLHTPLMSGSNAISGITIVGALLVAGGAATSFSILGAIAVALAMINVVGGFLVTHRMLAMFQKR